MPGDGLETGPINTTPNVPSQPQGEQVLHVLDAEGPIRTEVAEYVDQVVGEEIRNASPINLDQWTLATGLLAPDSSVLRDGAALSINLSLTQMPEGYTQAFILGTTMDGKVARLVSHTCAVANERLTLCGDVIARVGSEDNGGTSGALYGLGTLLGLDVMAGMNVNSQGRVDELYELGKNFEIVDGVRVGFAGGSFGPDAYGRLALEWAVREGINLNFHVFVPEHGEAQPSLTLVLRPRP